MARAADAVEDLTEEIDELLFWSANLVAHPMNRVTRRRVKDLCGRIRKRLNGTRRRERLLAAVDAADAAARETPGYRADLEG
jgi:hypothetical protein